MSSQSLPPEARPRRHDLVFVAGSAWQGLLEAHGDLAHHPAVAQWMDRGWPLVACRKMPGEQGIGLGMPLPPSAQKLRPRFVVQPRDIFAVTPPSALALAMRAAPAPWQPTLRRLVAMAARQGVEARVFGSLAWQFRTGLGHLGDASDLDLLVPVHAGTDVAALAAEIAWIERSAPMRIDGEFLRCDGAGVNWRELRSPAPELLVKTPAGAELMSLSVFLSREPTP